jgi:hypothetical protein
MDSIDSLCDGIVGLSIGFVLKLLCSSISVLLVNTITAWIAGDSIGNMYF